MKLRTCFLFFSVLFSQQLSAQYLGGNGDGGANELFQGTANGAQVATQLVFTSAPTNVGPTESFSVLVEIRDAAGNLAAFSSLANGSVALAIDNNPASGTLSGTTPVSAVDATATFSGMSINNAGFGYTLEATVSSLAATSAGIDVFCLYCGGSGDGGARSSNPLSTQNGQSVVIWRGGDSGNETDWATAANWADGAAAGAGDIVYIEPNGNGHQPVLTANTSIASLNFNSAQKPLELGNFNLTITGTVGRASTTEYLKTNGTGSLIKDDIALAGSFTFPVGNSSYNPLTITNNTTAAEWFSARVMDEVYEYGTYGPILSNKRVKRTWDIGKETPSANSGTGVDFVFNWNSGELSSPAPSTYALFHHDANGNGWGEVVLGTPSQNGNSFTFTGYQGSFSPFGIGDQNDPLPVVLLYFTGDCSPQGLDFNWATASEVNSQSFTLEHSSNLSNWQALHTQAAAGFSSSQKNYSALLPAGMNYGPYFRLHQRDFDGKFENFPPLHLECTENTGSGLLLYPNPSQVQVQVSGFSGTLDWQIIDASGRQLRSGRLNSEGQPESLPTQDLPAGLYIFQSTKGRLPLMIKE